jgi:hypothetical protein
MLRYIKEEMIRSLNWQLEKEMAFLKTTCRAGLKDATVRLPAVAQDEGYVMKVRTCTQKCQAHTSEPLSTWIIEDKVQVGSL